MIEAVASEVASVQGSPGLTCWKESSNSVCLDTEIFTWLGKALD